mgnify:CR=1 FL=1
MYHFTVVINHLCHCNLVKFGYMGNNAVVALSNVNLNHSTQHRTASAVRLPLIKVPVYRYGTILPTNNNKWLTIRY